MKILQLLPGAGNQFYCENCLRDNGLARELRRQGHEVILTPLYLPILTDESGASGNGHPDTPIFFGGINVYLQQKLPFFRNTPRWLDKLFDHPSLLKWAASMAGMTRAEDLAQTTLSMLKGEDGHQLKELKRLTDWLGAIDPPDVIHISNALLLGLAPAVKKVTGSTVVCTLQDEDIFVDPLPEPWKSRVYDEMSRQAKYVDAFIAVSDFYNETFCKKASLPCEKVHTIHNGIHLEGFKPRENHIHPPVIGFLERQCHDKGLHILADAFIQLKKKKALPGLKLRVAGGRTADDDKYIRRIRKKIEKAGFGGDVEFLPNPTREEKQQFLHTLSVLSVPAVHHEGFGLYVLESLAAGIPVVQPAQGAFPELMERTGGGILYEPNTPEALAEALETMLSDKNSLKDHGRQGHDSVHTQFSVETMTESYLNLLKKMDVEISV